METETLKRTPLYDNHVTVGARMVPFGGWHMPVQYDGILSEYSYTRKEVAAFDTCHMSEFIVEGDARQTGLDSLVSQPIVDMDEYTCRYGFFLNEEGKVIDDIIIFRFPSDKWMIVANASNIEKDFEHIKKYLKDGAVCTNASAETGKVDVQGPRSKAFLSQFVDGLDQLKFYTFGEFTLLDADVVISRTGYTGELGYEIYCPSGDVSRIWQAFVDTRDIHLAGLGARDVLRMEMGYCLYGHELNETVTPVEARLLRFIDMGKEFVGKQGIEAALAGGATQALVMFASDSRRSPRPNNIIALPDGGDIGVVTSGTFSPFLNRGVGFGFIKKEWCEPGTKIIIKEAKTSFSAKIVKKPIYTQGTYNN